MWMKPETYYERELKGKSAEWLADEVYRLQVVMRQQKYMLELKNYDNHTTSPPRDENRIHRTRSFLERAKQALEDAGGTYYPTEKDKFNEKFNTRLPLLYKLEFRLNRVFADETIYLIEMDEPQPILTSSRKGVLLNSIALDRDELMERLKALHMGEWLPAYSPVRFSHFVLDGFEWVVKLFYRNGRQMRFSGENDYPYNFHRLVEILNFDGGIKIEFNIPSNPKP